MQLIFEEQIADTKGTHLKHLTYFILKHTHSHTHLK